MGLMPTGVGEGTWVGRPVKAAISIGHSLWSGWDPLPSEGQPDLSGVRMPGWWAGPAAMVAVADLVSLFLSCLLSPVAVPWSLPPHHLHYGMKPP